MVWGLWLGQHRGAVVSAVHAVCHLVGIQSQRPCRIQTATLHQRRRSYCLSLRLVCILCRMSQQCPKSVKRDIQPLSTHNTGVYNLPFTQQQSKTIDINTRTRRVKEQNSSHVRLAMSDTKGSSRFWKLAADKTAMPFGSLASGPTDDEDNSVEQICWT